MSFTTGYLLLSAAHNETTDNFDTARANAKRLSEADGDLPYAVWENGVLVVIYTKGNFFCAENKAS
jgi:hypothetical protein